MIKKMKKINNKNWVSWFIGFTDAEGNFQTFTKKKSSYFWWYYKI